MRTVLLNIPEEKQGRRGWRVSVDGKVVPTVGRVTIESEQFGILEYGLDPGGFDRWSFHETGGWGSVTVPFVLEGAAIYIGVVEQNRVNQGGKVWNVPRGFVAPGEQHLMTANRETAEELGGEFRGELKLLPGEPTNPNSAFFESNGTLPSGEPEGVRFYELEFKSEDLEQTDTARRFKPDALTVNPELTNKRLAEQIMGCSFIPWQQAIGLSDMFTVAGVGRLVASLGKFGK